MLKAYSTPKAQIEAPLDSLNSFAIPPENITLLRPLQAGSFGAVYLAILKNKESDTIVAAKISHPDTQGVEKNYRVAENEIRILSALNFPHIISFHGFLAEPNRIMLVMEYMDGDTLWEFIDHPDFTTAKGLMATYYVALALEYLHTLTPAILHRDIKSENILRNQRGEIKVTDFGLSCFEGEVSTKLEGCPGWLAPEAAQCQYSTATDIFAFAVLVWEILSEDSPTIPSSSPKLSLEDLQNKKRLPIDKSWPKKWVSIIRHCWRTNPKDRWTIHQLLSTMDPLVQKLKEQNTAAAAAATEHPKADNNEEEAAVEPLVTQAFACLHIS